MAIFTLVRHGTPLYELAEERRLRGGARDWVPLSPQGIVEVEETAERLRQSGADLILSSPMTRALQTGSILSRALDRPLAVEFDLHEWLPDLTLSYDSVAAVLTAASELEAHAGEWPAGESRSWEPVSSVRRRALAVLKRYAHREHVIVACHGGVIHALTGERLPCGGSTIFTLAEGPA